MSMLVAYLLCLLWLNYVLFVGENIVSIIIIISIMVVPLVSRMTLSVPLICGYGSGSAG